MMTSLQASANFPIDAVYTWVDGADPVWLHKKEQALAQLNGNSVAVNQRAQSSARFLDSDELRYSLRSLALFAPWIRRVFIVTDDQVPSWLNQEHATIVSHRDIFPPQAQYPVFNNRPIEMCLHRISGLAENFIFFNDDFMLGRKVLPSDFFVKEGVPIVWGDKQTSARIQKFMGSLEQITHPHTTSVMRAHQLVYKHFGVQFPYKISHYPRAMTKTTMSALWQTFSDIVTHTLQCPFRTTTDLSVFPFYSLYLLASSQGQLRTVNGLDRWLDALCGRLAHVGASLGDKNMARKMRLIQWLRPQTFCLNDADAATDADREKLKAFLAAYFSQPSCYEREYD